MKKEKAALLDDFELKHFSFKKELLLSMLRELVGTSVLVNDLGELVFSINEPIKEYIFIEIYDILLDAIYFAREKKTYQAVETLGEAKKTLESIREKERQEFMNGKSEEILLEL